MNTYPTSSYDDLGEVITGLGIGEAVVTVMDERGAPTPVAWTRLRAPESRLAPIDPAAMDAVVAASPRRATYAETIDSDSARDRLAARLEMGAAKQAEEDAEQAARRTTPAEGGGPRHPGRARPGPRGDRRPGATGETSCTTW